MFCHTLYLIYLFFVFTLFNLSPPLLSLLSSFPLRHYLLSVISYLALLSLHLHCIFLPIIISFSITNSLPSVPILSSFASKSRSPLCPLPPYHLPKHFIKYFQFSLSISLSLSIYLFLSIHRMCSLYLSIYLSIYQSI